MRKNTLCVFVHFVWATWDRLPLITDEIEHDLHRYIQEVSQKHGCPVLASGGMPDHVHLLVQLSNTITLDDLMEFVKRDSSRYVNEVLKPPDTFKWQGSYGAFSVSPRDKSAVIAYIHNQKEHHGKGTTWPHAEESEEIVDSSKAVVKESPAQAGDRREAPPSDRVQPVAPAPAE